MQLVGEVDERRRRKTRLGLIVRCIQVGRIIIGILVLWGCDYLELSLFKRADGLDAKKWILWDCRGLI